MTTQERNVIELALAAMNECLFDEQWYATKDALKEALAQPEQEYGVVAGVGKGVEIPAGVKYYYIEPKLPPQRKPLTDEMIVAGGKALAKLHAESCGLDFDDVWKYYAEDHKADAKAAIEAAHGIKE